MKKYFSRLVFATFIMVTIFAFGSSLEVTSVSAQSMTLCQTVEALISGGVVSANNADAARVSAGCSIPPNIVATSTSSCSSTTLLTRDLNMGSTGAEVVTLQRFLTQYGYGQLTGTGLFGTATRAAVIKFQQAKGLSPATGLVGPMTRAVINSMICPAPTIVTNSCSAYSDAILVSKAIEIMDDNDSENIARGNFIVKVVADGSDLWLKKDMSDVFTISINGQNMAEQAIGGEHISSSIGLSPNGYLIQDGEDGIFTISYRLGASAGDGYYKVTLNKLRLACGGGTSDLSLGYTSDTVFLQGSDSTVSLVAPVAVITNYPTLKLSYDSSKKESLLTAKYTVSIYATSSDIKIPANPFFGSVVNTSNTSYTVSSGYTNTVAVSGVERSGDYIVRKGSTGNFEVTFTVKPSELFAGQYFARLNGYFLPDYQKSLEIVPAQNSTNKVTVIGETSPYINSLSSPVPVGEKMLVKGLRMTNSKVYIDDSSLAKVTIAVTADGRALSFVVPGSLSVGPHTIYLANGTTGKSNKVSFEVTGSTIQPVVTSVVGMIAGNGEINAGEKFGIQGSNLVSAGKDAVVYFVHTSGDKQFYASVTQYSSTLLYATAPADIDGSYNLYVSNALGTSNPVLVNIIGVTSSSCTDSDGGVNYSQYGEASGGPGKLEQDYCVDANKLREVSCSGNSLELGYYTCPSGCSNGACVAATVTSPSVTVLSPNGGETVDVSKLVKVSFKTNNTYPALHYINLVDESLGKSYSLDSLLGSYGVAFTQEQISLDEQSIAVSIPQDYNLNTTHKYKIEVCVSGICDKSNSYFKVVNQGISSRGENQGYATASVSWEAFLRLLQALR